ncbi:HNH endonuclease [Micromonospora chokoriensis]
MPDGRPAIPRELERAVLVEAGHRCAIPTCRSVPVELAHITSWSKVREHSFDNLIALCPTCHARFDRGDIDRKAMLTYKGLLNSQRDVNALVRANRVAALVELFETLERLSDHVNKVAIADVADEGTPEGRQALVDDCRAVSPEAKRALDRCKLTFSAETASKAYWLYAPYIAWASDVVDGLWPTTHPGADQHIDDVPEAADDLIAAAALEVDMTEKELWDIISDPGPRLGGSLKKY